MHESLFCVVCRSRLGLVFAIHCTLGMQARIALYRYINIRNKLRNKLSSSSFSFRRCKAFWHGGKAIRASAESAPQAMETP